MVFIPTRKVETTNSILRAIAKIGVLSPGEIDILEKTKYNGDFLEYEEAEKRIPLLILDVLKKEATVRTKLVAREHTEENAWFVEITRKEQEILLCNRYEVEDLFVKIRAPAIFVKTVVLPIIAR